MGYVGTAYVSRQDRTLNNKHKYQKMNPQQTLKALYQFTIQNYESLKQDYNKMPQKEKSAIPLPLFIIGVFANLIDDQQKNIQDAEIISEEKHVGADS